MVVEYSSSVESHLLSIFHCSLSPPPDKTCFSSKTVGWNVDDVTFIQLWQMIANLLDIPFLNDHSRDPCIRLVGPNPVSFSRND